MPAEGLTAIRLSDGSVLALGGDATMGPRTRLATRLPAGAASWIRLHDAPVALDTPAVLALTAASVMVVAPSFANGTVAAPSRALLLEPMHGLWFMLPQVPVPLLSPRLLRLDLTHVIAVGAVGQFVGAIFDLHAQRWATVSAPISNLASYTTIILPDRGMLLMATVAINGYGQPYPVQQSWLLSGRHEWSPLARPPELADGAQAVLVDGQTVLFAGGRPLADNPNAPAPPPMLYNDTDNAWSIAGRTGQNHRDGQLVGLGGGRGMLIGGQSAHGAPSTECLLYAGHGWQEAAPLPGPWARYAVVALSDTKVLLMGGDRGEASRIRPVADTMIFSLDPAPLG